MTRRFMHRWLGHWALQLQGMVIVLAVLWAATQMELLLVALITAAVSLAMLSIGWLCTR